MKSFQQIVLDEYFEPTLGKALRVMLAFVLPLIWGMLTADMTAAVWIAISAEILSMVNIRGTYPLKLLILSGGVVACAVSAAIGTLAGHHWLAAAAVMMVLAFLGGFVRQSGDHGPGITIGVLLLYLLSLDHPGTMADVGKMMIWVLEGGILALLSTLLAWSFVPFSPFRRSISLTWKVLAEWIDVLARQLNITDSVDPVSSFDEKELAFRNELNESMATISRKQAIAHARQNRYSYQLVELRRLASEAGNAISGLRILAEIAGKQAHFPLKLFLYVLDNFRQAAHRIAISIVTHRYDDVYTVRLSMERLSESVDLFLKEIRQTEPSAEKRQLEQMLKNLRGYLSDALSILEHASGKSGKMTFFLQNFLTGMTIPQHIPWVRFELNPRSFTFRFSLRLALAMGIGIALYKIFDIPHGYWIAMTTMIVLQPEFGATITKALNRTKGTLLGATFGSLIFLLSFPFEVNIGIVVICSFLSTYFLLRNYAVAAFFITVMVVALFHLLEPVTWQLGGVRVINTLAGCGLALLGGFAFFPLWERYRFPALMDQAIKANRYYLKAITDALADKRPRTFNDFIKFRREAEMTNNNAFLSLRRMKSEPGDKQRYSQEYFIITGHNIRITRLLNTLNQQIRGTAFTESYTHLEDYEVCVENIMDGIAQALDERLDQPGQSKPVEQVIKSVRKVLPEAPSGTLAEGREMVPELLEKIAGEAIGMYQTTSKLKLLKKPV